MLCKYCTDFDLDALDSIDGYHHHNSVRSLQESASNGCKSCMLIRAAHREHEGGSLDDSWCGSGEDSEITMHMTDFGMIEVSQIERRKSIVDLSWFVLFISALKRVGMISKVLK